MSNFLILFVAVLYLLTAGFLYYQGKLGLAITFFGYAFSNVGLYLASH